MQFTIFQKSKTQFSKMTKAPFHELGLWYTWTNILGKEGWFIKSKYYIIPSPQDQLLPGRTPIKHHDKIYLKL